MSKSRIVELTQDLEESKDFQKLSKEIGESNCKEFYQRDEENLRSVIAECELQISEMKTEVEKNPAYAQAKSLLKDFNKSRNEASKVLKLKKKIATHLISYRKS